MNHHYDVCMKTSISAVCGELVFATCCHHFNKNDIKTHNDIFRWRRSTKIFPYKWGLYDNMTYVILMARTTLQWRHNERDGVWNHETHDCLLNHLFSRRSKKTPQLCVTGLFVGNSPLAGEIPAQRASNVENVSICWHHHDFTLVPIWESKEHYGRTPCYKTITIHTCSKHYCILFYDMNCRYLGTMLNIGPIRMWAAKQNPKVI